MSVTYPITRKATATKNQKMNLWQVKTLCCPKCELMQLAVFWGLPSRLGPQEIAWLAEFHFK